jgi:hypothetical protein
MVRPLRIECKGAWYHVMNRGLERKNIFLKSGQVPTPNTKPTNLINKNKKLIFPKLPTTS